MPHSTQSTAIGTASLTKAAPRPDATYSSTDDCHNNTDFSLSLSLGIISGENSPSIITMASVPSAVCLLAARSPYYRIRLNSTTGMVSNGPCSLENAMEHEKSHQGFLLTLEKCWWIKNFLSSETPQHPINTELPARSHH